MKTTAMLKAVLDSSVLISAFITPTGICGILLDGVEAGRFRLALSLEILAETEVRLLHKPKLMQKYGYAPEHVERFCDGLLGIAELVTDLPEGRFVPDDPKDDIIVATAIKAGG